MLKHYIYLAGPITGLTYEGAIDWRNEVAADLDSDKLETLSPLRGKDYLLGEGVLHAGEYKQTMSTAKGITRRDFFDCTRSGCVLVNLLGTKKVSIGTVMEVAWAYQAGIPIVTVMEQDNLHNHAMLNESSTYVVRSLEEAVNTIRFLFNDRSKPRFNERKSE